MSDVYSEAMDDSGFNFEEDLVFSGEIKPFEYQFLHEAVDSFKQTVEESSSALKTKEQLIENKESSSSFDESKFELSSSELSLNVLYNSGKVLNSTFYNENEGCINILLESLLGKIDPQNTLPDISEKSTETAVIEANVSEIGESSEEKLPELHHASLKTNHNEQSSLLGTFDNLMDVSISTAGATFGGSAISSTDAGEESTKMFEETHQEAKACSVVDNCDLINLSHKTNMNHSSELSGAIDNLMDVSTSTFENEMSHFPPPSNDNCMITGNVLYSVPMEEENSKEIVGECVSAFETENQQNDHNESSSFDESKFDLSSSDLSLSVLNNSRRVLNSTCYNEDEGCINILLQSLLGKIDPQNTLREISKKSVETVVDQAEVSESSKEKSSELHDASLKTNHDERISLPDTFDNLMDASLSTVGATFGGSAISGTDAREESTKVFKETHQKAEDCSLMDNCPLINISHKTHLNHSNVLAGNIDDLMNASLSTVGATFDGAAVSGTNVAEESTKKVFGEVHQEAKNCFVVDNFPLINISHKMNMNHSIAPAGAIDNLMDASLSTFEDKMSYFPPLSNDTCTIAESSEPIDTMEEENSKQTVEECVSAFETENQQTDNNKSSSSFDESKFELSSSDLSLNVLNNSEKVLNSTCYNENESCVNILLQSLLGKIDLQNTLQEKSEKTALENTVETTVREAEVSDIGKSSEEKLPELHDASLKTNHYERTSLPGAFDNMMDASISTVGATFGGSAISGTDAGEESTKVFEETHQEAKECSLVDNCDLINISHKTNLNHSSALAGAIDNLMDASFSTIGTTFDGAAISSTNVAEESTKKLFVETHQEAKDCSFVEKCDLINISSTTNLNHSSALAGTIDNLMDASLSTFEDQMSHFPSLSNDGCMIAGNSEPSVPMEEENLIEVSISLKSSFDEITSKIESKEVFENNQQEKVDSTNADSTVCDQVVVEASTVVTPLPTLSEPVGKQKNLLDISVPNLEMKIDFVNSATIEVCSNILEDEIPENLLSNSDSDSECGSTDLKTSEKKAAQSECQSGKKREIPSEFKYSEGKLKKPRTFLPVPTSIARLRSPLAAVNRSVNLISNTKLTESTSKKLIFDDEANMRSISKIPSLLSKNENLCHSQLSHIRKPFSVSYAKEKTQDKTGISKSRQIPTNLSAPKGKLNFAASSGIPSLATKAFGIPIGENRGNANKALASRLPKLQRW